MTLIVKADNDGLVAAAEALRAGRPVVVPTDTVYGLAALAADADAIDRLFVLKDRPPERSIAVLVADAEQALELVDLTSTERHVVTAFWPGALTLVARRRADAPSWLGRSDGTVGIRAPHDLFTRQLARLVGPLATTSANRSGGETPSDARLAAGTLTDAVAVVVDDGLRRGSASTVAVVDGEGHVEVLRYGPVTSKQIESAALG